MYWRAVDSEGEILDVLVQPRRDRKAALKLMRKLLKKQGVTPDTIVTDIQPDGVLDDDARIAVAVV